MFCFPDAYIYIYIYIFIYTHTPLIIRLVQVLISTNMFYQEETHSRLLVVMPIELVGRIWNHQTWDVAHLTYIISIRMIYVERCWVILRNLWKSYGCVRLGIHHPVFLKTNVVIQLVTLEAFNEGFIIILHFIICFGLMTHQQKIWVGKWM